MKNQQGQTLIETIVAVFILVMGITAALGLANYSLNVTSNIRQQTIAMGLAREGIEVVKAIRDTNWLRDTLATNCHNFETGSNNAYCYQNWLNPGNGGQDITGTPTGRSYIISYDPARDSRWVLEANSTDFGLEKNATATGPLPLYYVQEGNPVPASGATSGFARKITITTDNFHPFDESTTGPRLKVTSQVWWSSRNCQLTNDVDPNSACLVTLETYLTNWKNY